MSLERDNYTIPSEAGEETSTNSCHAALIDSKDLSSDHAQLVSEIPRRKCKQIVCLFVKGNPDKSPKNTVVYGLSLFRAASMHAQLSNAILSFVGPRCASTTSPLG